MDAPEELRLEAWIKDALVVYSYWAIVLLVALEGDVTLVVAGMLAHDRLLGFGFETAFVAAMAGAVAGDVVSFMIGRHIRHNVRGSKLYQKFHPRLEWLEQRFGLASLLIVKWIYGLRFASSVFWGMSRMRPVRFTVLSLFSCGVWVSILLGLGWLFGTAVSTFLNRFQSVATAFVGVVVGVVALREVHRRWISPRLQREAERAGLTCPPGEASAALPGEAGEKRGNEGEASAAPSDEPLQASAEVGCTDESARVQV